MLTGHESSRISVFLETVALDEGRMRCYDGVLFAAWMLGHRPIPIVPSIEIEYFLQLPPLPISPCPRFVSRFVFTFE